MSLVNLTSPARMLRFGLLAFALATSARLFLHPAAPWGDVIDAASGFATGVLLASFLLSVRRRRSCPRG
jgi:hypothetical protein